MKFFSLLFTLFIFASCTFLTTFSKQESSIANSNFTQTCANSSLWGTAGELWKSEGPLADYSYAGYRAGEQDIPHVKIASNVKTDFHAVGDGITDDTQAFLTALKKSPDGAIFIPAGIYKISQQLQIKRSNLVLRGEGPEKTILYFPKSMADINGTTSKASEPSKWSFGPGLILFQGHDPIESRTLLANVTADANRGDTILKVSSTSKISVGQWVRLIQSDPPVESPHSGSLLAWFVGNLLPVGTELRGAKNIVRFQSRVKTKQGNQITLERSLPYDVRSYWQPALHRYTPSVHDVGIEHLAIRFPETLYPGHFKETGFNAISMMNLSQCWIRNIKITNADFGIDFANTSFCTGTDITLDVSKSRGDAKGWNGHHGMNVKQGVENLITNFHINTKFIHDISVEWYALNTVYSNGSGVDLNMDHHRAFNFSSLFTNLDLGKATRPFASSGKQTRGPHSASYSTFWNLRSAKDFALPKEDFGPRLNFVSLPITKTPKTLPNQWSFELMKSEHVCQPNLHDSMQRQRLQNKKLQPKQ